MNDYEKLGVFYLGREEGSERPLLYASKDLTTHAVCVGMTGSGKTGLCLAVLEEAAMDGIPVIAVDPKGDLGNLLLQFPGLSSKEFEPWVDPSEASRKGMDVPTFAATTAATWRKGLAMWGQDGERIRRLGEQAEFRLWTPGSTAGLPVSVLRSFQAPPEGVRGDAEQLGERIDAAASGLLSLLGVEADPLQSREHILLARLLHHAWERGDSLDLPGLLRGLQSPPFDRVGFLDLETFFPAKDRMGLVLRLNNLLASPGFQIWLQGEALDIGTLLRAPNGKPRVSILSIAHLNERERMFFVTLLLNELVAWMRGQSGTSSLRALFYMDEIFGYFPPTANPPSKKPMLTLLKQARACGLGCVLATQNPVDLDYKGLSNTGTWFIGRLQTERDKLRVLDGLESAGEGAGMDRAKLDRVLSGLGNRRFLLHNVHEREPVLMETRWVMSYLRGPLTREQIRRLSGKDAPRVDPLPFAAPTGAVSGATLPLPAHVGQAWQFPVRPGPVSAWVPHLHLRMKLHYVKVAADIDLWEERDLRVPMRDGPVPLDWEAVQAPEDEGRICGEAPMDAPSLPLPAAAARASSYSAWEREAKQVAYEILPLLLLSCRSLQLRSEVGESPEAFRERVWQRHREARDTAVESLRLRHGKRYETLRERIGRAEAAVEKKRRLHREKSRGAVISIGSSLLGALLGRRRVSVANFRRAGSALNTAGRLGRSQDAMKDAESGLEELRLQMAELEQAFDREAAQLEERFREPPVIEEKSLAPRKTDIRVLGSSIRWIPAGEQGPRATGRT